MATPRIVPWLRRRFIAGFIVAVPLVISVAAMLWGFHLVDDLTGPLYDRFLGRHVAGLGAATTVLAVLFVGIVVSNVFGRRLLARVDGYLERIPVFRTIYSPVKQLLAAFSPDSASGLKRVVMVPDATGATRLGFLTKEFVADLGTGEGPRAFAAVYVPTNNLYLGDVFVYPFDALRFPDLSVEEGVKVFLTGGMAMADRVAGRREPPHDLSS